MNKIGFLLGCLLLITSCSTKSRYTVTSATWKRIPVTETSHPDSALSAEVNYYKKLLDTQMNQVIAYSGMDMMYGRPESLLTNFTSDAMLQAPPVLTDGVLIDLTIMNVHGHRASLALGDVSVGDIYRIYSFDNALVRVDIKGKDLLDIFRSYAQIGGAGLSGNVRLVIKDKQLLESTVDGDPVDPDRIYHVLTLDYLAEGNDHMEAFTRAVAQKETGVLLRDYMLDYIQSVTRQGKTLTSRLDGRITVKP